MPEIKVNLPREPYSIVIEPGSLSTLGNRVRAVAPHARCLLAMDRNVIEPHGSIARQSLADAGFEVATATLIAHERLKTTSAVEALYRDMLAARLERTSPVIALGGGIVGDIAGYAAATYLRGVPLIHAPTTLLAMVDAAIGGKTGVNFPLPKLPDLGKNLVGAFWQPRLVVVDPDTLRTLSRRDFTSGLAECVKHAMIADAALLTWLEEHLADILDLDGETLTQLITRSAASKAAIVADDERETGRRALLNLGHTFAHAIEAIAATQLHHGEAVALGIRAAAHVAVARTTLAPAEADRINRTLTHCGLPERLAEGISIERLMLAMTFDKKVANNRVRLVLPRGIGAAEIVDDVPPDLVRSAWRDIGAVE